MSKKLTFSSKEEKDSAIHEAKMNLEQEGKINHILQEAVTEAENAQIIPE